MIVKVAGVTAALVVVVAGALVFGLWRLALGAAIIAGGDDE